MIFWNDIPFLGLQRAHGDDVKFQKRLYQDLPSAIEPLNHHRLCPHPRHYHLSFFCPFFFAPPPHP